MPNEWIIALKKWNTGKETWCLPRKGSKAYDEVRALMPEKKLKASAPPEKAPEPESKPMSVPLKDIMKKKKPIRGDVAPPAPPMKIPIEPQRKAFSDKDAPKVKFVEPAKKAEPAPKVEEPPRRKTDRERHVEEVAEALPEIKRLVGDKPLMKLSKAVLLEIVKLGHHKIGRFNLPDIYKDWYYSTGTSVYSKMTGAKKEDIIKHIQSLPSLTRNVFPKLS